MEDTLKSGRTERKKLSIFLPILWLVLFFPSIFTSFLSMFFVETGRESVFLVLLAKNLFVAPLVFLIGGIGGLLTRNSPGRIRGIVYLPLVNIVITLTAIVLVILFVWN